MTDTNNEYLEFAKIIKSSIKPFLDGHGVTSIEAKEAKIKYDNGNYHYICPWGLSNKSTNNNSRECWINILILAKTLEALKEVHIVESEYCVNKNFLVTKGYDTSKESFVYYLMYEDTRDFEECSDDYGVYRPKNFFIVDGGECKTIFRMRSSYQVGIKKIQDKVIIIDSIGNVNPNGPFDFVENASVQANKIMHCGITTHKDNMLQDHEAYVVKDGKQGILDLIGGGYSLLPSVPLPYEIIPTTLSDMIAFKLDTYTKPSGEILKGPIYGYWNTFDNSSFIIELPTARFGSYQINDLGLFHNGHVAVLVDSYKLYIYDKKGNLVRETIDEEKYEEYEKRSLTRQDHYTLYEAFEGEGERHREWLNE